MAVRRSAAHAPCVTRRQMPLTVMIYPGVRSTRRISATPALPLTDRRRLPQILHWVSLKTC